MLLLGPKIIFGASQVALVVKNLPASAGHIRDSSSIPGSGRSPGEGNGNPLQYSCLENYMDRRAWDHKSQIWLSYWTISRANLDWKTMRRIHLYIKKISDGSSVHNINVFLVYGHISSSPIDLLLWLMWKIWWYLE